MGISILNKKKPLNSGLSSGFCISLLGNYFLYKTAFAAATVLSTLGKISLIKVGA